MNFLQLRIHVLSTVIIFPLQLRIHVLSNQAKYNQTIDTGGTPVEELYIGHVFEQHYVSMRVLEVCIEFGSITWLHF